ncbi:quinone oxidoreductase [Paracoccus sp. M683]|uniref:quinone oxidoreductase family protein n=1 Tax=Paracoccus sp. M683 TaxID=2594268 RepID=UPI00117EAA71|nr:quinone oxidoreductase [Paracoccus sp. M683]TRW98216.1 quinone oxidoreductase [Paracoccus sp. M683]
MSDSDYVMVMPRPGTAADFQRREIATPQPGEGQVLLRQQAVGLNFLDVYHRNGTYPWPVERDLVPGSEGAGVVEAVGPDVTGLRVGDRVAYTLPLNAYASARLIAADRLVRVPDGITAQQAATLMLKGLTAHYLITSTFPIRPGMIALVQAAAGGVGQIIGPWIRAQGGTVIGTAGGAEKTALARDLGYDHVIDYGAQDVAARVAEITGGKGVNVVYDGVGQATWKGSLASLAVRGMMVSFGQSSGAVAPVPMAELGAKSLFLTRPTLFQHIADPAELQSRAAEMFAALADGKISAQVSHQFPLAEVARAHDALEARQTTGATVLIP